MSNQSNSPWTEEKVALLRDGYRKHSISILAEMLGLSRSAVKSKAERISIQQTRMTWTEEKDALLRELWPDHSMEQIISIIGSSKTSTQERAVSLGLTQKGRPGWPAEKEELLRELWPTHSASCIAEKLGTTHGAVIGKAHRLKLLVKGHRWRGNVVNTKRRAPKTVNQPRRRHMAMTTNPVIPVIPAVSDVIPIGISIFDLEQHHCRWPVEEPGQAMKYCGHQVLNEQSYCGSHYCMVYQPTNQRIRASLLAAA